MGVKANFNCSWLHKMWGSVEYRLCGQPDYKFLKTRGQIPSNLRSKMVDKPTKNQSEIGLQLKKNPIV